jgi:two-component system response regulator NreC
LPSISILLVESHPRLRRGIRRLLETDPALRVISEATEASEAVHLADECGPEIVVTEIALGDGSGIEAARKISARRRETGIVFLSMHSDVAYVVGSMKAGGRGYVLKDTANQDLCQAIHAVKSGSTFHSPVIVWLLAQDCVQRLQEQRNRCSLSEQEREVIQRLAKGKNPWEIAPLLGLDLSAVEALRFEALQKVYLRQVEPGTLAR